MSANFILTLGIFIGELLLGFVVYLHDSKSKGNRLFLLFIVSGALWTLSNYLTTLLASDFWNNVSFAAGPLIFYFLLLFTEQFPSISYTIPDRIKFFLHATVAILVVMTLLPGGVLVRGIDLSSPNLDPVPGPLFLLLPIYDFLLFGGVILLLYKKLRKSSGVEELQLQYVALGCFLSAGFGLTMNLVIPILTGNYDIAQYGPYSVIFLLLLTTIAIVRYHLLNITLIATEVITALLLLILLVQVIFANGTLQIIGSVTVLVLATVLAYFLIRSMLREVRQKEQLTKLTTRLEEVNTQLKYLDETKSEFVSIASHQLRTPLTVIKGYLSMMIEGSFGQIPKDQAGPIEKVYESANRLIELVENLLSVSRIESGRMKYNLAPTQLADMAASVVQELTQAAQKKKLVLTFTPPPAPLPLLNIDAEKVRQVMMNLVDNAVKYTKKGSVAVTVRLDEGGRLIIPERSVVFEVRDTGGGVRKDDQDRLFQKFIRGQGSSLVHTEGNGLGLYVGRMMVEAHGGHIWVESPGEDKGSLFAFAIPVNVKTPVGAPTPAPASAPTPAAAPVAPSQAKG